MFFITGRTKGLAANLIPEGPQRGLHHVRADLCCIYFFCLYSCPCQPMIVYAKMIITFGHDYSLTSRKISLRVQFHIFRRWSKECYKRNISWKFE